MNLLVTLFEKVVKIAIINASDQNSNQQFLRNDFTKIFEDLFYDNIIKRYNSYS